MICNAGTTQCSSGSFQSCKGDGSGWISQACDFVCDAQKGCGGSCTPGDQQCSGTASQTCDATGNWTTTTACPFVCVGKGLCSGTCVPGDQQCSGINTQTCNSGGYWTTTYSCAIACNYTGGVASCGGACTNGTKQCSGKVPQICTNNEWTSGAQCPFICSSGTCGGECVPGSQKCGPQGGIQTCSVTGLWQNEGAACPFTCSGGVCGGVCVPNATCSDDGNACTNDVCNALGTACTHPAKTDGTICGSTSSSACDNPDSCQAGVCQPNPKPAQTPCTNDGNVCTNDVCDGLGACQHPAAPAATVCRAASCSNGVTTAQATCGGSTSCPVAQTTNCFGSCDLGGLVCANPAPQKVDDVPGSPLAIDNDASFIYASARSTAGVSQIVQYAKQNGAKTVLYQSADSTRYIYAMIVAGPFVYFSETSWNGGTNPISGQVSRISTSGAGQTATFISSQATFGFAKNSTRVYWNDGVFTTCGCSVVPSHHVYSVAIGGTAVTPFALNFGGTEVSPDLEVTDTDLYLWQMAYRPSSPGFYAPFLTRYNLSTPANNTGLVNSYYWKNGTTTVDTKAAVSMVSMPGLTKNGESVFADTDSTDGYAVLSFNQINDSSKYLGVINSTNFPQDISNQTLDFVADAQYVYLNNKRVPVNGGSFSYWTNHELSTGALSIDNSSLYFGSWGYWNDLPYDNVPDVQAPAIFKVLK